ncbi:MAG: alkylresorcinol/alkylpyrone synthase [Mycobacterium sp.]|jgi:alkylresorcinol/alkylpyrone synthase|nr:alkylresorcinol/alkylpyrone synthase [Mycobacterium sp.]
MFQFGLFDGTLFVFRFMAETTYFTSADQNDRLTSGAPHIAGTAVAFPPNRYKQEDVARELTTFADQGFMRFAQSTGVDHRSLALPLSRYPKLTGFTEANAAYIEVAVDLGERGVLSALDAAGIAPDEVDVIVTVSSTGVAVPTIDARLAPAIGLRPDVLSKDVPKMVDVYLGEEVDRFLAD